MLSIQLADGTLHNILNEEIENSQEIALVSAQNNQDRVIIPIYFSQEGESEPPRFIGKITLNKELGLSSSENPITLRMELQDKESVHILCTNTSGEAQDSYFDLKNTFELSEDIQLSSLDDIIDHPQDEFIGEHDDFNFTIDQNEEIIEKTPSNSEYQPQENSNLESNLNAPSTARTKQSTNPLVITILAILATSIVLGFSFLFFQLTERESIPFMQVFLNFITSHLLS